MELKKARAYHGRSLVFLTVSTALAYVLRPLCWPTRKHGWEVVLRTARVADRPRKAEELDLTAATLRKDMMELCEDHKRWSLKFWRVRSRDGVAMAYATFSDHPMAARLDEKKPSLASHARHRHLATGLT